MRSLASIELDLVRKVRAIVTGYEPTRPCPKYRLRAQVAALILGHYAAERYGLAFAACIDCSSEDVRFFSLGSFLCEAVEAKGLPFEVLE